MVSPGPSLDAARKSLLDAFKRANFQFPWKLDIKDTIQQVDRIIREYLDEIIRRTLINSMNDTISRQATLKRMIVLGNKGHPGAGILWGSLIDRIRDRRVRAELGIPDNINLESMTKKALLGSVDITTGTRSSRAVKFKFEINYNRLRKNTPHPGAQTPTGQNIKVQSWLDWLTGDVIVTDAGFVTLKELGASPTTNPKSPRAQTRVGNEAGWMIKPGRQHHQSRNRQSRIGKKGIKSKSSRRKIKIPQRWRISKPLPKTFLIDRSNLIGAMMLDFYGDILVQRAARRAIASASKAAIVGS
jgi:hypothetical protein